MQTKTQTNHPIVFQMGNIRHAFHRPTEDLAQEARTKISRLLRSARLFYVAVFLCLPAIISANAQPVALEPFTGVKAGGILTIELVKGDTFQLVVDGPEEIASAVSASIENNLLNLDFHGSARNLGRVRVMVVAPEFRTLSANGLAAFTNTGILATPELHLEGNGASNFRLQVETPMLHTQLSGASVADLSGFAYNHIVTLSGAAQLKAGGLDTDSTNVDISGASIATVNARNALTGRMRGTSGLATVGTPLVRNVEGSGVPSTTGENLPAGSVGLATQSFSVHLGDRKFRMTEEREAEIIPRKRFHNNWTGLELGFNGYLTADNSFTMGAGFEYLDLRYEKSISVNLNLFQQSVPLIANRLGMFSGIGFGWNNYRFGNDFLLSKEVNQIGSIPVTEPDLRKNKLTITWINVPLMLEYQTQDQEGQQKFFLSAGLNIGARIGSYTKQVYFPNDGREKRRTRDDFHLNPFRYDVQLRMGYGKLGIFASYSLNTLFRDNRGPELHPFSMGLRLVNL